MRTRVHNRSLKRIYYEQVLISNGLSRDYLLVNSVYGKFDHMLVLSVNSVAVNCLSIILHLNQKPYTSPLFIVFFVNCDLRRRKNVIEVDIVMYNESRVNQLPIGIITTKL